MASSLQKPLFKFFIDVSFTSINPIFRERINEVTENKKVVEMDSIHLITKV